MVHQTESWSIPVADYRSRDNIVHCTEMCIRILTAKSEYHTSDIDSFFTLQPEKPTVRECVKKCQDGSIEVIIDVPKITDSIIYLVLQMIAQALDKLGDSYGIVYFSPPLTFNDPWITKH